jgi:hypothetical protein
LSGGGDEGKKWHQRLLEGESSDRRRVGDRNESLTRQRSNRHSVSDCRLWLRNFAAASDSISWPMYPGSEPIDAKQGSLRPVSALSRQHCCHVPTGNSGATCEMAPPV